MLLQAAIPYYKLIHTEFGIFFLKTLEKIIFVELILVYPEVLERHNCLGVKVLEQGHSWVTSNRQQTIKLF